MMDPSKKSRIPTRVCTNPENCINPEKCRYLQKENFAMQKKTVEQVKTFKTLTTTAQNTNSNLNVPIPRHRLLSDTALLPPKKRVKIAVTQPKVNIVSRPPLGDLDKNIANKYVEVPEEPKFKKNVHIVKTVTFKNADNAATHFHKKVEEFTESKKVINTKHGYETNTYRSKLTQLTNYKIYQPTITDNFPVSTSVSSKPTTSNQAPTIKTPELNAAYLLNNKNITVRQKLTPHPKTFVSKDDSFLDEEIFFDSSEHFISFKQPQQNFCRRQIHPSHASGYISPIKPNLYATKSTVIFQGIPEEVRRPAKKMTLSHKMHAGSRQGNSTAYCVDIYNTEYLNDIVYCQLKNDWKYVLKTNLKMNNPITIQTRAAVVNWLIQAQDYLNLSPTVFFTTIRLFDRVLGSTSIACNMCQLVGLVITWIINKFEDGVNILTGGHGNQPSKMLTLCNGVYTNREFLKMEKKLLTFFNFDLKIPDVTVYVVFYIRKLKIESDLLLHSAFYILECYTLNVKFSTVTPSVQAASAVRLALNILSPLAQIWKTLEKTIGYYSDEDLDDVMKEMLHQLHKTQDPAYEYRQPYQKYAVMDKLQVSITLLRKLVAT